jgi:hypothetical protein
VTILVLHICDAPPPSSNWHHVELQIPSSSGDMCETVCGNIGSLYQPLKSCFFLKLNISWQRPPLKGL